MNNNTQFAENVRKILFNIEDILISKNKNYGDSVGNPLRVFSKSDSLEAIKVRIDDKLSRILRGGDISDQEDTINDLIGYLIILKIELEKKIKIQESNIVVVNYEIRKN